MRNRPRFRSEDLELHRLDGRMLSLGCQFCPLLSRCGGQTRAGGGWSCLSLCQNCDPQQCDVVCLGKPETFVDSLREVNGFGWADIGTLVQPSGDKLPRYIPVVQHEYSRHEPVQLPWVAIPLSAILKRPGGVLTVSAETPEEFRQQFHLSPGTKLLLLGTGEDEPIEKYWEWRTVRGLPEMLANLGWNLAVVPNYSFFLDEPRTQHLHNRKRSLICAREWSAHSIPTVPYLGAVCPQDYDYWLEFLLHHPEITVVAKEFQTGGAQSQRGLWAIDQIATMQERLKRSLHLIAIGGAQFRFALGKKFDNWTVLDSMPFMKAVRGRRRARRGERRVYWERAPEEGVASLFDHGAGVWGNWVADPIEVPPLPAREAPHSLRTSVNQTLLPFT